MKNNTNNDDNGNQTSTKRSSDAISSSPGRSSKSKGAAARSRSQGDPKKRANVNSKLTKRKTQSSLHMFNYMHKLAGKPIVQKDTKEDAVMKDAEDGKSGGKSGESTAKVSFSEAVTPEKEKENVEEEDDVLDSSVSSSDEEQGDDEEEQVESDTEEDTDEDEVVEVVKKGKKGKKSASKLDKKKPSGSSKKNRPSKSEAKSLRGFQSKLKKSEDGDMTIDTSHFTDSIVVELSGTIFKGRGDEVDQVNKTLAQTLQLMTKLSPEGNVAILPKDEYSTAPPLLFLKDMPDYCATWFEDYISSPNPDSTFTIYGKAVKKGISLSLRIGVMKGSAASLVLKTKADLRRKLNVYVNTKSLQLVDTNSDVVLLNCSNRMSQEEVLRIIEAPIKRAFEMATESDPDTYPPEEYEYFQFGVKRTRAPNFIYDATADKGPLQVYCFQVPEGKEDFLFNILEFAIYHKLLHPYFGKLVEVVMANKDGETYPTKIATHKLINASLSHQSLPGMVNPHAKSLLKGCTQHTPDAEYSLWDVLHQIEIVGDGGITKDILSCIYDRQTWYICYIDDTKAKRYFSKWASLFAVNVYHFLKRRGFTVESILRLLKKSCSLSALKHIKGSKYDPQTKLAVPTRTSSTSSFDTLAKLGISTSGLTKEEKIHVGIEVPDGAPLSEFIGSDIQAGDELLFRSDDMSARSYFKDSDGKTVNSSTPMGGTVGTQYRDDSSSIESGEVDQENDDLEGVEEDETADDVLRVLEQHGRMNSEQRKAIFLTIWATYGSILSAAVEQGREWSSLLELFGSNPDYPVQVFSYLLSFYPNEILATHNDGEKLLAFRQQYMRECPTPGEESSGDEYDDSREDDEFEDDDESNENDADSENGSQDMDVDDDISSYYLSQEDFSSECVNPKNQAIYDNLLQLIKVEAQHLEDTSSVDQRLLSLVKGARLVLTIEETITPKNALRFGKKGDPLKLDGIGKGIADRIDSMVRHGFLPGYVSIEKYTFPCPETVWQSYYNSCGPSRENLYNAVKLDRETFTANVSDNEVFQALKLPQSALSDYSMNGEGIRMLLESHNGNYSAVIEALSNMESELSKIEARKIRPPFTDQFLPVVITENENDNTTTEPPCSSATGASSLSNENRQSRGGSVADESEDTTG